MGLLTREGVLGRLDRKTRDVEVPEWGGTVRVAELTGLDRVAFEAALVDKNRKGSIHAALLSRCLVNENLEPMFTEAELDARAATVLTRLWDVAVSLNAVGAEEEEAAKKNSKATDGGAASSG